LCFVKALLVVSISHRSIRIELLILG